jgi:hypothetical protein
MSAYLEEGPVPYLYRTAVESLAEADDPRTGYPSVEAEMIARAPHTPSSMHVDNAALAKKLLKEMVVGFKDAITWARDSFRSRDGQAVMQLDAVDRKTGNSGDQAETTMIPHKEKPRFTLSCTTSIHRICHNDINSVRRLAQPPMAEMDELLKVRKYLTGIEAPEMAAAVHAVRASPTID